MIGGHKAGVKFGGRSEVKVGGQCQGVKVRGRGSRSGGLGSDGRWDLVGGRLEINRECSFQEFHSMFYPMPNCLPSSVTYNSNQWQERLS